MTAKSECHLHVKPFGVDRWVVNHLHSDKKVHFAGTIQRKKAGLLTTYLPFNDMGMLIPGTHYTLHQAVEKIRNVHYQDMKSTREG